MVEGPTWRYRHLEGDNGTGSQPWNAFLLGQEGRRGQQTANEGDRLSATATDGAAPGAVLPPEWSLEIHPRDPKGRLLLRFC